MMRALAAALSIVSAPLARGADLGAEAAQTYRVETKGSTTSVKQGGRGKVVLAFVPIGKVHVHPQAPLKITLESAGLVLGKASLGHQDAVDPKAEAPRFEVPFVAQKRGRQEAKAKLDFFVCSDQWCVKQVKDVVVPVDVK